MKQDSKSLTGEELCIQKDDKGILRLSSRAHVTELKNEILYDAHNSIYSIHSETTDMYQDLKKNFGGQV